MKRYCLQVYSAVGLIACKTLLEHRYDAAIRELDDALAQVEAQIFHEEGSYIKETPCGNVIRGFESFHDRYV